MAGQRRPDGTLNLAKLDQRTIRALRRQGDVWRRLLTGQQAPDQLLDGHAYVGAATSLITNARRIAFRYLWKWSWAVLIAIGAAATAIWAALTFTPAGAGRVIAVLLSGAGFLGVSWAGARATLGSALRQAENALWEVEVVAAIGKAATIMPEEHGPHRQAGAEPPAVQPL